MAAQNPAPVRYPDGRWTLENWYAAVLRLPLVSQGDRDAIAWNLRLMRGWRWNLIALSVLGVILAALVLAELWRLRKTRKAGDAARLMSADEMLAEERQDSPAVQNGPAA